MKNKKNDIFNEEFYKYKKLMENQGINFLYEINNKYVTKEEFSNYIINKIKEREGKRNV